MTRLSLRDLLLGAFAAIVCSLIGGYAIAWAALVIGGAP